MSDDVRVYRMEVLVIDHDQLGPDGARSALENARYPNDCMSPKVVALDERLLDWSDDHPLNKRDGWKPAYEALFAGSTVPVSTIAHVMRNALVPSRYQLGKAGAAASADEARERAEAAQRGVTTALEFVDALVAGAPRPPGRCLRHTDPDGPDEHYTTPFDPAEPVPCPCPGGCPGMLRVDGRNVDGTLMFLCCDACACAHVAKDGRDPAEPVTGITELARALVQIVDQVARGSHGPTLMQLLQATSALRAIAPRLDEELRGHIQQVDEVVSKAARGAALDGEAGDVGPHRGKRP